MSFTIRIVPCDGPAPAGKLADAEVHFSSGILAGLKLIGFAVWQRRGGEGLNVTFPARSYSVNGERRSFALLRPSDWTGRGVAAVLDAQAGVRDAILQEYRDHVRGVQAPAVEAPEPARGISPDTLAALAARL